MNDKLTQLGHQAALPASPDEAVLETVPNPHPGEIYLVRHAEKAADGSDDPPLSEAGKRHAQALAAWFDGKPLAAVYATHLRRTQQTALPVATARDLDLRVLPAGDSARLVQRLRARDCGQPALVVGHSNTVPEIAAALGAAPFSIPETEFGWVYMWKAGQAEVQRVRYAVEPTRAE